jgi:putative heme iron utilization protein
MRGIALAELFDQEVVVVVVREQASCTQQEITRWGHVLVILKEPRAVIDILSPMPCDCICITLP